MVQVVIVGDRDSGKTTFLGLLYLAQVKSGSDRADRFRFHATIESLEEISTLFQGLMSGSFPDSATKEGIHEMSVHLGYRKAGGIWASLRPRGREPDPYATFRFILPRSLGAEVSRFLAGSSVANGSLRDSLEGDAIVILVDSSKLEAKSEEPPHGAMDAYDSAVESFLTANERWRPKGDRRPLYPIFILAKFDRVKPEVLRAAEVDDSPPPAGRPGPRAAYAEALLGPNLPKTLARVRARKREGLALAPPSFFFSWVRTERASSGRSQRIRLRRTDTSGWEPEYSREEYLALLEHLWEIAANRRR